MERDTGAAASGSGASRSRGRTRNQPAPRKAKRRHGKARNTPLSSQPYLVTAPPSVTAPPPDIDRNLILPSTYVRSLTSSPNPQRPPNHTRTSSGSLPLPSSPGISRQGYGANLLSPPAIMPAAVSAQRASPSPTPPRGGYAANLLSPPSIMPGGRSAEPIVAPFTPMVRSQGLLGRTGRLGSSANNSQLSLARPASPAAVDEVVHRPNAPRRPRRRVVQESIRRRRRAETVSTVEEGRAVGLSRGASMRRVNVWDGACMPQVVVVNPSDLPQDEEPPPPFPFQTRSNLRQPPTFAQSEDGHSPDSGPSYLPPIPDSPPPSFDVALTLPMDGRNVPPADLNERPISPTTTAAYVSAPSSPISEESDGLFAIDEDDNSRLDRRLWNADILAGYTLEERVRRETARRKARSDEAEAALRTEDIEREEEQQREDTNATPTAELDVATPTVGVDAQTPKAEVERVLAADSAECTQAPGTTANGGRSPGLATDNVSLPKLPEPREATENSSAEEVTTLPHSVELETQHQDISSPEPNDDGIERSAAVSSTDVVPAAEAGRNAETSEETHTEREGQEASPEAQASAATSNAESRSLPVAVANSPPHSPEMQEAINTSARRTKEDEQIAARRAEIAAAATRRLEVDAAIRRASTSRPVSMEEHDAVARQALHSLSGRRASQEDIWTVVNEAISAAHSRRNSQERSELPEPPEPKLSRPLFSSPAKPWVLSAANMPSSTQKRTDGGGNGSDAERNTPTSATRSTAAPRASREARNIPSASTTRGRPADSPAPPSSRTQGPTLPGATASAASNDLSQSTPLTPDHDGDQLHLLPRKGDTVYETADSFRSARPRSVATMNGNRGCKLLSPTATRPNILKGNTALVDTAMSSAPHRNSVTSATAAPAVDKALPALPPSSSPPSSSLEFSNVAPTAVQSPPGVGVASDRVRSDLRDGNEAIAPASSPPLPSRQGSSASLASVGSMSRSQAKRSSSVCGPRRMQATRQYSSHNAIHDATVVGSHRQPRSSSIPSLEPNMDSQPKALRTKHERGSVEASDEHSTAFLKAASPDFHGLRRGDKGAAPLTNGDCWHDHVDESPGLTSPLDPSSALLSMLEAQSSSGAESSAQGAARAAARSALEDEIKRQADFEKDQDAFKRALAQSESDHALALTLQAEDEAERLRTDAASNNDHALAAALQAEQETNSDHALAMALQEDDSGSDESASVPEWPPLSLDWPGQPASNVARGKRRAPPPPPPPKPRRPPPPPPTVAPHSTECHNGSPGPSAFSHPHALQTPRESLTLPRLQARLDVASDRSSKAPDVTLSGASRPTSTSPGSFYPTQASPARPRTNVLSSASSMSSTKLSPASPLFKQLSQENISIPPDEAVRIANHFPVAPLSSTSPAAASSRVKPVSRASGATQPRSNAVRPRQEEQRHQRSPTRSPADFSPPENLSLPSDEAKAMLSTFPIPPLASRGQDCSHVPQLPPIRSPGPLSQLPLRSPPPPPTGQPGQPKRAPPPPPPRRAPPPVPDEPTSNEGEWGEDFLDRMEGIPARPTASRHVTFPSQDSSSSSLFDHGSKLGQPINSSPNTSPALEKQSGQAPETPAAPPLPLLRRRLSALPTVRPRGPRTQGSTPPPVPPRPWAKVAAPSRRSSRFGNGIELGTSGAAGTTPPLSRPELLRSTSSAAHSSTSSLFSGIRLNAQGQVVSPQPGAASLPVANAPSSTVERTESPEGLDRPNSPGTNTQSQESQVETSEDYFPEQEITDVDLYASRLEGAANEYEGLNRIIDFLGPVKQPGASPEMLSTLIEAPVIVESRRVNAAGKVKIKLSVLGVRVTTCPVCLSQYRGDDRALLMPRCGHIAHENCARRWYKESDCCMVCREKLIPDDSDDDTTHAPNV